MSADTELDGFELVEKGNPRRPDPQLTIYANGGGYLNAAALEVLEQCPAVRTYVNTETNRVAVIAAGDEDDHAYSLHRESETAGGDFRAQSMLSDLGVDVEHIEETHQFGMDVHDDRDDVLVADVSGLCIKSELIGEGSEETEMPAGGVSVAVRGDSRTDPGSVEADDADVEEALETVEKSADEIQDELQDDIDTADVPDHSANEVDDVPAIEDEEADTVEKVREYLDGAVDGGSTLETTCGEIGDAVGEDGRAIPHALKKLDDWRVEKLGRSTDEGASIWAIARPGAATGETEGDADGEPDASEEPDTDETCDTSGDAETADGPPERKVDRGDNEDVEYWCGYCGQGPFVRSGMVEGHHDRTDHPGKPIFRTVEPVDNELEENDRVAGNFPGEEPSDRVVAWVEDAVPDRTTMTTEDVAIECDLEGNEAFRQLNQVSQELDDYVVEQDGRLWHIRAPTGGDY